MNGSDNPRQHATVHLVNPLSDVAGSEWRTIELYNRLSGRCNVSLWSAHRPHPRLRRDYPINKIAPLFGRFPKTGVFVFVGTYFPVGWWLEFSRPTRVILVCNTYSPKNFHKTMRRLSVSGFPDIEVVYASEILKTMIGRPGLVEHSLVDLSTFSPSPSRRPADPSTRFTIGRLSRDVSAKHHPNDPALYLRLAEHGCSIRVMGGTCLKKTLRHHAVTLLPADSEMSHTFLQGLDCFYYRISDTIFESFGRVVAEAMACGLPVVCHRRGGYTEIIDDGRTGFLFETDEEAFAILMRLKNDPVLRRNVGRAARAAMETVYSPDRMAAVAGYYLGEPGAPPRR